ncbi:hypothetical protein V1514DRAFT_333643 [Lipomyces japonicus]|uniref:uncharacterized protein n=1 Tax=Lipomyces japonicus TaxID=56871 RepID=UPI0034CEC144
MSSYYKPPIDSQVLAAAKEAKAKKQILVSSSSSVTLSNELALLKEKFIKDKAKNGSTKLNSSSSSGRVRKKRGVLHSEPSNKGIQGRIARDEIIERQDRLKTDESYAEKQLKRKARQYDALKKGYTAGLDLNDSALDVEMFVAGSSGENNGNESESEVSDDDLIEHTDEFGRTRLVSRYKIHRFDDEHDETIAKVSRPDKLIYGDKIQYQAFHGNEDAMRQIFERDDSLVDDVHYDASKEIRTKGVGFYDFSQDAESRSKEMEELKNMREETLKLLENSKKVRENWKLRRENRRKLIDRARQQQYGNSWLSQINIVSE